MEYTPLCFNAVFSSSLSNAHTRSLSLFLFLFFRHCPSVHWTVALQQEMNELKIKPYRLLLNHVWHEDGENKKNGKSSKRERKKKLLHRSVDIFVSSKLLDWPNRPSWLASDGSHDTVWSREKQKWRRRRRRKNLLTWCDRPPSLFLLHQWSVFSPHWSLSLTNGLKANLPTADPYPNTIPSNKLREVTWYIKYQQQMLKIHKQCVLSAST